MVTAVDFDVVVIGAGGAGLAAAVSAAERGASVLLVEAAAEVGGSTALSGGSFMAAGTSVQAAAGHAGDTADAFFDHYLTFNRWQVDAGVARRFCDAALPTFTWLTELGVEFNADGLYRAAREPVPRSHRPVGAGASYVSALHRAARLAGIDIALGTRVESLVVDETGRVTGVRAGGEELSAAAVVLTTGGFGANADLVRELVPEAVGPEMNGPGSVWSPAVETCRGDGIGLAEAAGAELFGCNGGDLLLTAGLITDVEPYPPSWLVMVGADGRRFVDEGAPYAVITPLALTHGPVWVVLDDGMLRAATGTPGPWGAGTWTSDVLRPAAEQGRIESADSLAELATATDLPEASLVGTVRRYNEACQAGHDPDFLKDPAGLVALETGPFHAVRVWPAVVAVTSYGPRIDPDARVLNKQDGSPVPGLFAAGEVTGNVLGPQYLGGGNAMGSALIFGRLAGAAAAAEALERAS